MSMFAVLDNNNIVINTIVAESLEIAEQATGATCIEFTYDNPAFFLSVWDGKKFLIQNLVVEGEVVPPAIEG